MLKAHRSKKINSIHRARINWTSLKEKIRKISYFIIYIRDVQPFDLHGPHLIKYYNSIDICYSKKTVNNVEIRTLLFF